MGKLIRLNPTQGWRNIPRPVGSLLSDQFIIVDTEDRDYPNILPGGMTVSSGGFFVVRADQIESGFLHAIKTKYGSLMVTLVDAGRGFSVESHHHAFKSGHYEREQLDILGCVWEIYPVGETGPRWVLWTPNKASTFQREAESIYSRPLLALKS